VADLNDIAVFVTVARFESFSRAAHALGMPVSTVSRKVTALEERLGVTLLQRTTRKLSLTAQGRAYCNQCSEPLSDLFDAERHLPARHPRGVAEDVADFDVLFSVCAELGPVFGDGRIRIQAAAVDEQQRRQRGDVFGAGEDVDDRVLVPLPGLGLVDVSAPHVDDHLAVDVDCDGRAELAPGGDLIGECGGDVGEAPIAVSGNDGVNGAVTAQLFGHY